MGYSEDGFLVTPQEFHRDVICDTFGPSVPGDEQMMLETAMITGDLVAFDWNVIQQALSKSRGGVTPGVMPPAGILIGANGFYTPLTLSSPLDNSPFTFYSTRLIDATPIKIGTIRTIISVTFRAVPYKANADSSAGAILYTRS